MKTDQTVRILHLSDLHFTADAAKDKEVLSWCDSLIGDIKRCLRRGPRTHTFVVISGDLTFSGQRSEFKAATEFLLRLLLSTQVPNDQLLLVPGNHDVSRFESSRWRRKAFFDCARSFLPEGDSPQTPLRRFEKQGVVFLMPGVLEESDTVDLSRIWRSAREAHSGDLRVAVTHYPLDWAPTASEGPEEQDDTWWLESASRPFLAEATPQLQLFGHHHSEQRKLWSHDAKHSFIAAGSGPLSCESWRRFSLGPPSYRLIAVSGKRTRVRTRVFLHQSRRWVDDRLLPTQNDQQTDRLAVQHSSAGTKDQLVDRLCELSQYEMLRLVDDLGAAVEPYSPVRQSKEEFALTFVDYFAQEGRLDYFDRCLTRLDPKVVQQKLRVFVVATAKGRRIGQQAARRCRAVGVETSWPELGARAGDRIGEEVARNIRAADILLVVISDDFTRSHWMAREVGLALRHGGALAPRIVPILMPGVTLPEPFKGLNVINVESSRDIRADELAQAIRAAAKRLLHSGD